MAPACKLLRDRERGSPHQNNIREKDDFCQLSFLLKAKIRSDSDNCDEQHKIFKELNAVAG
jgi:hypothetical protein